MWDVSELKFSARRRRKQLASPLPSIDETLAASVPAEPLPAVPTRPDDHIAMLRALDAPERMVLVALLDHLDEAPLTFRQWVDRAHPGFLWAPHLVKLAAALQDVADGLRRFLLVFMPPRHGKSELVSRLFSAYYLYRHPTRDVALTTYGAELSYELSRNARDNFIVLGGRLAGDASAVKSWHTAAGGNLWATGAGGPATGRGFHLGIVDDPYKDAKEAASAKVRRARWSWYQSVFLTRAAPGHAIVVLVTRWHVDDLPSQLLREEDVTKVGWHVLDFAAEKRSAVSDETVEGPVRPQVVKALQHVWPASVTVEPDVRDHERWLWTQRFPIEEYEAKKRALGGQSGYFWNALYQQRPTVAEGTLYKRDHIRPIAREKLPPLRAIVRWWDLGATEGDGKYTAGLKVGKTSEPTPRYIILGLCHGQWHPGRRDQQIKDTALSDGHECAQCFPQDPGAAGKAEAEKFKTLLSGISVVRTRTETGDKALRATLPASDAANGRLWIVDEPWAATVVQELVDYVPNVSEFTDIVDALSGAHAELARSHGIAVA